MTVTETTFWSPSTLTLLVSLAVKKQIKTVRSVDISCSCPSFSWVGRKVWSKLWLHMKHGDWKWREIHLYTIHTPIMTHLIWVILCPKHALHQICLFFLGKRPSKNLQGTVASGNEQRRILPRSCGARTIFGEIQTGRNGGFQLMVKCWFGIWSWYPQGIVPFTRGSYIGFQTNNPNQQLTN